MNLNDQLICPACNSHMKLRRFFEEWNCYCQDDRVTVVYTLTNGKPHDVVLYLWIHEFSRFFAYQQNYISSKWTIWLIKSEKDSIGVASGSGNMTLPQAWKMLNKYNKMKAFL